jgi:DNA polymerase-1
MKFSRLKTVWEILEVIERLNQAPYVVLDTETTGLTRKDKLVSLVLGYGDEAWSFGPEFAALLQGIQQPLCLQNFKFDFHMLRRAGVDLSRHLVRDTMLMHHLLDENAESHSLDSMVQHYFKDNYKEVFWSKYDAISEAPEAERLEYECKDVIYTGKIFEILRAELHADEVPDSLIEHVHRLALSLWETEHVGVAVDLEYTMKIGVELQKQIESLKPRMRNLVDTHCEAWELDEWVKEIEKRKTPIGRGRVPRPEFSFDSSKQLGSLLYDRLRLTPQFDPKTRKRTTGDDALAKLETEHVLIPLLRDYRGLQKVYGSYIEGTLERMQDGRIYPEFNVNGTATGRISHSNPNMGQLPATGGIRGIYIPDPGNSLLSADYKQLEVVLAAHFSRDANLLRVVYEGASLHDITADGLGIPRAQAKTINFAIQYGAGKNKIKLILGCSDQEAQGALTKYWETYSGLKRLIDECHYKVDQGIPIVNPFGRKRRFPTEFPEWWMKAKAQRQSFNALIQGTGGDLTSRAFYLVAERMRAEGLGRALFTVHDEILISSKNAYCNIAKELLISTMKLVGEEIKLTVPLAADVSEPMSRWED